MKKLLLALTVLVFFTVSCENTPQKNTDETKEKKVVIDEVVALSLMDFDSLVEGLAGRKISISGTVDHVCKHGGQKMFIVDETTDARVKITPNEDIAAFNTNLIGETVEVMGIVEELRIDDEYLTEWEEEVKQGDQEEEGEKKHIGNGEGNHDSANNEDHDEANEDIEMQEELEQIAKMKKRVEESEKGYLSFYSILALEFKVYKMH